MLFEETKVDSLSPRKRWRSGSLNPPYRDREKTWSQDILEENQEIVGGVKDVGPLFLIPVWTTRFLKIVRSSV